MLNFLNHNPFPVAAYFRRSLVLTYSCPPEALRPLLHPGLDLDTWQDHAFLAVAMVQTENLHPTFLPAAFGRDFFLSGHRIFVRHGSQRGLQILRSDTDKPSMVRLGNLFTRYHYRLCRFDLAPAAGGALWTVRTPTADADVEVLEHDTEAPSLPPGSVFTTEREARRFAGPLPVTYARDESSAALFAVRAIRQDWSPRLVPVDVRRNTFLPGGARLAAAFAVRNVAYRWMAGTRCAA